MDFLILFLLLSTTSIRRINGGKQCTEQECTSGLSQWCCPYNATCGSQNICNNLKQASDPSYCRGEVACFSDRYYWCCQSDQTCGGFRKCKGGSVSTTSIIIVVATVGFALLIAICGCFIRYRYVKNTNANHRIHLPARNQGVRAPMYLLTNNTTTRANPFGTIYTIFPPPATVLSREEPPPIYDAAVSS